MIEENLTEYLLTKSDITDLIVARIYPNILPQDPTFPSITYNRVSGRRVLKLNPGRSGLAVARFHINCWAETYSAVKALAEEVRIALQGYQGVLSDGVSAQAVHFYGDWDQYESETHEYRVIMDFEIWHTES